MKTRKKIKTLIYIDHNIITLHFKIVINLILDRIKRFKNQGKH